MAVKNPERRNFVSSPPATRARPVNPRNVRGKAPENRGPQERIQGSPPSAPVHRRPVRNPQVETRRSFLNGAFKFGVLATGVAGVASWWGEGDGKQEFEQEPVEEASRISGRSELRGLSPTAEQIRQAMKAAHEQLDYGGRSADAMLLEASERYEVDPSLLLALMFAESGSGEGGKNVTAVSYITLSDGTQIPTARGLMQFTASTQKRVVKSWSHEELRKILPDKALRGLNDYIDEVTRNAVLLAHDTENEGFDLNATRRNAEEDFVLRYSNSTRAVFNPVISWNMAGSLWSENSREIRSLSLSEDLVKKWAIVQYHSGKAIAMIQACRQAGIEPPTPEAMFRNRQGESPHPAIINALKQVKGNKWPETQKHYNNVMRYLPAAKEYLASLGR